MFSLKEKNALVTGASGGIGSEIAKKLAKAGANLVLSGTREGVLNQLRDEILSETPHVKIIVKICNLSDAASVDAIFAHAEEALGQIDIVVNNAGVTRDNLLMRMKDDEWQNVIDINLTSMFRISRAAVKAMMRRRNGRIINISSVVGVGGNPGQTNYCASKAGMIGFSKALAQEVATRGITVNCVAPGFIASAMTDQLNDKVKEKILSGIPMGEMGSAEDIAAAVLFLAAPDSCYVTGQTLHVNGGMLMV